MNPWLRKSICMIFVCFLVLLVACTPTKYSKKVEEKTKEDGLKHIEEFLDEKKIQGSVEEVYMMTGRKLDEHLYAGYYPSYVVGARVKEALDGKDRSTKIYYDLEEGKVYTDALYEAAEIFLQNEIGEAIKQRGFAHELTLQSCKYEQAIINHNVESNEGKVDVEVILEGVFPEELEEADISNYIATDRDGFNVSAVTMYFCSEDSQKEELPGEVIGELYKNNKNFNCTEFAIYGISEEACEKVENGEEDLWGVKDGVKWTGFYDEDGEFTFYRVKKD